MMPHAGTLTIYKNIGNLKFINLIFSNFFQNYLTVPGALTLRYTGTNRNVKLNFRV